MGKKGKYQVAEDKEMTPLYIDTTCNRNAGITSWEGMYSLLEEENPRVMEVKATTDSRRSFEASITELACSFLHRIVARPKILPYTDMVKWVLDSADITDRKFKSRGQDLIGSFTPQYLRLMDHLPELQETYNKKFVEKFSKDEDLVECTKNWSAREEPLKKDKHGMYSTSSLSSPYCFVVAMLCRLFGRPDSNKFSSEWLPLLDAATNATIMDWALILSNNLASAIWNYRAKRTTSQRIYPPFFLAAYVMDAICYVSEFPLKGWKWTIQNPLPIHIYHKELWDSKFIPYFYKICHGIMLRLHRMLYNKDAPRFFPKAEVDILLVKRWFWEKNFTYVRVFGSISSLMYYPYMFLISYWLKKFPTRLAGWEE